MFCIPLSTSEENGVVISGTTMPMFFECPYFKFNADGFGLYPIFSAASNTNLLVSGWIFLSFSKALDIVEVDNNKYLERSLIVMRFINK